MNLGVILVVNFEIVMSMLNVDVNFKSKECILRVNFGIVKFPSTKKINFDEIVNFGKNVV